MKRLWSFLNIFEESIMVIGMTIMVFFNFFNVVCRYLLPQTPFSYTEELVILVFIWVSMFGISYGYRKGSHTILNVFTDRLPFRFQPFVIFFAAASSAVLMLLFAYTGYRMVMNQVEYEQVLPGMRIPMPFVSAAIPLGAAVTFISILKTGFEEMKGHFSRAGEKKEAAA